MDESFELSGLEESFVEETVNSTMACDKCQFSTKYGSSLKRHKTLKHTKETESQSSKAFVCDQCGKEFKTMTGLRSHDKNKHKQTFKYTCSVCNRGYNGLWNFKGHLASHHEVMREICKTCGAK